MNLNSSITIDILGIIALCFTMNKARRNIVIDNYKTKIYITASSIVLVLMILEIVSIVLDNVASNSFITLNKIVNIAGFSLSPIVPYTILLFNMNNSFYHNKLLITPIIINLFICILSYKTGWVFSFNEQNQYTRGSLFLIPTIVSMFYYISLITSISKQDFKFDNDDKSYLLFIVILPIISTVIQILFKEIIIIWGSVSISLLLYYIFLRELQFKFDTVSKIKNRSAFEKELECIQKNSKNAALVVLDLNNLKKINDNYGHKIGDSAIALAADLIKRSFDGIGEPFRIGGDEFCVICINASAETIKMALSMLDKLIDEENQNNTCEISLAYGYEFYEANKNKDIFDIFSIADKFMYEKKAKQKGLYGRRKEDK